MLPVEVWEDGRKKELPDLRFGGSDYDYILYRAAYEITHCLEKWLQVPLDYGQTFLPAYMMMNEFDGPIWMHPEQRQEIGDIRNVVRETRKAKQLLKEAISLERNGDLGAARAELDRLVSKMIALPPPVSLWIANAACTTFFDWQKLLENIHRLFVEYAKERAGNSGHKRARTVAMVVRALYDVHSASGPTIGVTEGVPDGDYGRCVQEVFSWAGIPVNFYRYAYEAWQLPDSNEQLIAFTTILRESFPEQIQSPKGPIVYTTS